MEWPELPEEVVLYGIHYPIRLVRDLSASDHRYGETNYYRHEISIDAALPLAVKWATLCHEVLHVIDGALTLGLKEDTVRRLDSGIFEFLSQLGIGGSHGNC